MVAPLAENWQQRVIVRRTDDGDLASLVAENLEALGLREALAGAKQVFLKPNLVSDVPEYIAAGSNTDVRIIEAVLQALQGFTGKVLLGESETGTRYKGRRLALALENMGVPRLQERYDFEIVNLTEAEQRLVTIPQGRFLKQLPLSVPLLESDLIINLPKLKTHKYATITCALKNMFGVIPDPMRVIYHQNIHQVLADLNALFWEQMFVVVDGLVGMEGQGPLYGKPVPMNLLLFARNPLAADIAAATIMGFDWRDVRHLRLFEAQRAPLGTAALAVEGTPLAEVTRPFAPARKNLFVRTEGWLMQFPPVVRLLFSDFVRGNITRRLQPLLKRLRGGSYSWYHD